MTPRRLVIWLSEVINRNTGYLIVVTLVVFGFAILSFQQDNRDIISDTHAAVKNTEYIIDGQEKEASARDNAVIELTEDNRRQTIILCTIIVRGNIPISESDAKDVGNICDEEIQRFSSLHASPYVATPRQNMSQPNIDNIDSQSYANPQTDNHSAQSGPVVTEPPATEQPEPPQSGVLRRSIDGIVELIKDVL